MKLMTMKEVTSLVRLSRTHINRLEAENLFPTRVRLGKGPRGKVLWDEAEVLGWIAARKS